MKRLIENIRLLTESVSLNDLDFEDIKDIFNIFFRTWLQERKPEINQNRFAISYLLRRYFKEFAEEFGLKGRELGEEVDLTEWNGEYMDVISQLYEKGKVVLPSYFEHDEKFLESYKKKFDFLMKRIDIPNYLTIEFHEPKPYILVGDMKVDFEEFLKSDIPLHGRWTYEVKVENLLKNYLGLEVGDSKFGDVELEMQKPEFFGYETWLKTKFSEIKKQIKKIVSSENIIRSIRGTVENEKFNIKVIFSNWGYLNSNDKSKIREIWKDFGYSESKLRIK